MAKKLDPEMPLDEMEEEILFTRCAMRADPDAEDLAPRTDGWMGKIDVVRMLERKCRESSMFADASRSVANVRLDGACTGFADELLLAVRKDRSSTRWLQFFRIPSSVFTRQGLGKQVDVVKGWLSGSQDEVLEKHRPNLARWSQSAGDALVNTQGVALVRGELAQAREKLAEELTRERDAVRETLAARARERGLPREWPDAFFRTTRRHKAKPGKTDTAAKVKVD